MDYYQIPVALKIRSVTSFCTPFGLYEFIKLPMGISVGSQALSRVVDELFADLKLINVFNFLDDFIVYTSSPREHLTQVRDVLSRLPRSAFILNTDKVVLLASEFKYLGLLFSAMWVKFQPDMVTATQDYPRPVNLRSLRSFIGIVGFYARFFPAYGSVASTLHELKKRESFSVRGRRIRRRSIL